MEESIQEMQSYLKRFQDTEHEFGPSFHKYFHLHYNKDTGHFVYGEPKLQVIRDELICVVTLQLSHLKKWMRRNISKESLEQKIAKIEKAISKNREQYDRLTAELEELHKKQKAIQDTDELPFD